MVKIVVTGWEITPDMAIAVKHIKRDGMMEQHMYLPDYEASDVVFEVEDLQPGDMITIENEG